MRILIHFNRKKQPKGGPVQFEVVFSRTERIYFSPGVSVEKKYWDQKTNSVKPDHPDHMFLNSKIENMRKRLLKIAVTYNESGKTLTPDLFRLEMEKAPTTKVFNEFLEDNIRIDGPTLKESTYKRYSYFLAKFNAFRRVLFTDLTPDFIRQYHNYLLKNMTASSTSKHHKALSKYIKRAVNAKLIEESPYKDFKIPTANRRMIFLTNEELERIREKKLTINRLIEIRDMFLFMCNTGMEYRDLMALTWEDVQVIDGNKFIVKPRIKVTTETQAIPLLPEADQIIEKYANDSKTGLIFPKRSNQKINSYLKEIGDLCEITKPLTTIIARHTFATLMLTKGIPLETVSHILGHSNTKTTRIYAKLITSKISADFERLNVKSI